MLLLILLSRCISFDSYIKPQLLYDGYGIILSCISFDSYIKPQLSDGCPSDTPVVYLLIPTSNHNVTDINGYSERLYIFWFLHQTTTSCLPPGSFLCCISFDSYIKPQLILMLKSRKLVVYLLIPTSNHNIKSIQSRNRIVVYLLIPTSNHNTANTQLGVEGLYIFWFLHQTTTTTLFLYSVSVLYIFWFLHQTTTACCYFSSSARCISFDSYIKPQLIQFFVEVDIVVYLLIPTSNHNYYYSEYCRFWVVYLLIPTSNHNLQIWTYWFSAHNKHSI